MPWSTEERKTAWLLLAAGAIVVALVYMASGCAQQWSEPPVNPHAAYVVIRWVDAGLEEPRVECELESLQVRRTSTESEYLKLCPPNSWACLRWANELAPSWPIAVIAPHAADDQVDDLAVHELLHGLGRCSRRWEDVYDYRHEDMEVWAPYGLELDI